MMRNVLKTLGSLRAALVVGVGLPFLIAASAFAQDAKPSPSPDAANPDLATQPGVAGTQAGVATAERIVVTGTYIPTAEAEGALPVTQYSSEQLIKFGSNSVAEGLRQLPSFVGNTQTENDSNGGNGVATVNLRALGPENTLTLINGRRAFSLEDVNGIPFGFIGSAEVLKDGASATYGADAVAGVVNLKIRHAEGNHGEIDLLYGNTDAGVANDSDVRQAFLVGGIGAEKWNVTAGVYYYNRETIQAADTFLSSVISNRFGGQNAGSPTFPGRVNSATLGSLVLINPATVPTPGAGLGDYRPFDANLDQFSFRAFSPAIPSQERSGMFVDFEYKVLPDNALTLFGTAIYANTQQNNGLAASPFVLFQGPLAEGGDAIELSPYNPDPADVVFVRYRSIEGGNRKSFFQQDYYHYIFGLKGEIAKDYWWELGSVYDENTQTETDSGDQQRSLIVQQMLAGNFNPFIGIAAPKQGTVIGTDGLPHTYDNVAAIAAASFAADSFTRTQDYLGDAKIGGNLFKGWPQGGINFVVGGEYRHDDFQQEASPILNAGDQLGFTAVPSYTAEQDVYAALAEVNIPIVSSTQNIPGIYALEVGAGYRYEKYDLTGPDIEAILLNVSSTAQASPSLETDVPAFKIRYQPYKDLTLRTSYSRSFRAPQFFEFFTPITPGADFPNVFDPLNRQLVQPLNGDTIGGSLDLQPERSDAWTAGAVFTPSFVPGFTITVDYYQNNTTGVIVSGGAVAQFKVNQNFATGAFADQVVRDPASGELLSVNEQPFNAGRRLVEGLDITAIYELPTDNLGKFTIAVAYNHLFRFDAQAFPGAGYTNFLGQFSSAPLTPGSLPYNKGYVQLGWDYKGLSLTSTVNYIGDYMDDGAGVFDSSLIIDPVTGSPPDPANPTYTRNRDVKAYITLDLQAAWTYTAPKPVEATSGYSKEGKNVAGKDKMVSTTGTGPNLIQRMLDQTTIRVGMTNVTDEPPPFSAGAFNDNYDTSLYSIRGRYYYIGLNKKF